jgi:hypothetical protein
MRTHPVHNLGWPWLTHEMDGLECPHIVSRNQNQGPVAVPVPLKSRDVRGFSPEERGKLPFWNQFQNRFCEKRSNRHHAAAGLELEP